MRGMVIYCERTGDGVWSEPFNALTSLIFLFAAWFALRIYRRLPEAADGERRWDLLLLAVSIAVVGGAGLLWHTLGTHWTGRADVIAMLVFVNLFVIAFSHRVAGLGTLGVLIVLLGFQWISVRAITGFGSGLANGAPLYYPMAAALWLSALYALVRLGRRGLVFGAAALVFTVSLAVRGGDLALCPRLAMGTHFAWHLLNAAAMYLLYAGVAGALRRSPAGKGGGAGGTASRPARP